MKIAWRFLLGYALIVALAAVFVHNVFLGEVKPGVRQAMEATLADTAHVLARLAAPELQAGTLGHGSFARALHDLDRQPLDARIWGVPKSHSDYRVYVADRAGRVVFDSTGKDVGKDYSRWNDVYLTLRGQYGVRSTRTDPADENSSVMHVAAPVRAGGTLLGVLTVAKANRTMEPFIERGRGKIVRAALWLLALSLGIGIAFSLWITGSLRRLVGYAERVGRGEKAEPPALGASELAKLSRALATMRERLEGKQYVERYVHALTHEMKSPLTTIQASAELLGEEMPLDQRQRFAGHVRDQAERLRHLVERMLGLASVESRQRLDTVVPVELAGLIEEQVAVRRAALAARGLTLDTGSLRRCTVPGDRFLLGQALGNLVDNAIAFSPDGGRIEVGVAKDAEQATLTVTDQGSGVPDYAVARVFERFYSLPRPGTDVKSTGLGLPFVREVAGLHRGTATLANRPDGGAIATLVLPLHVTGR